MPRPRDAPEGKVTEFPLPVAASFPNQMTVGPDGAIWFTENYRNFVGRITSDGKITELAVPIIGRGLYGITVRPTKNLWITDIRR